MFYNFLLFSYIFPILKIKVLPRCQLYPLKCLEVVKPDNQAAPNILVALLTF